MKIRLHNAPTQARGFALIATISVMVLLTLIALAMLSLSTLEIRAGRHADAQAEAQANARMALQIALGQLQSTLGPDARATANASILDTDPSSSEINGVLHPHWLGVYPTVNPNSPDDSLIDPRSLRDWSLENMEWLVSNADNTTALDPTANINGNVVTLGQFIKDASVVIPQDADSLAATQLTKAQAGLVKVEDNSGRYAWWIGDESMKARVNTLASIDGSDVLAGSSVDADDQRQSSYQVTQSTNFSSQLPTYKETPEKLFKLVTHNQLERLGDEASDSSWKSWSRLNQDKFTPYSLSLPVDVVNGKLKQDLTAYLKGSYTGHDKKSMIDSRFSISADRTPTFDLLKQWANLVDDPTEPQDVVAANYDSSNPSHGLYPVITQGAVAMQHSYEITGTKTFNPVTMIMPQFQLWNPHNVPLKAQDYIIQIGYQFRWWMQTGLRNTDKATYNTNPVWHSWEQNNGHTPLPPHKPADNEDIDYQDNKRFFTFVIKNQAFEPGESLLFHAKPPSSGSISGVPYNINSNADTDILKNYSNDADLNLLVNEGNLDEFFYLVSPSVGTLDASSNANLTSKLKTEPNFRSDKTGSGASDDEDLDMHLNLYSVENGNPTLLHAIKKPQRNERFGNWQRSTYPLSSYLDGSRLASDTYDYKSALINFGSSMLVSNFDIFVGGSNMNKPPKAGQPHSMLSYWNVRNQQSFSGSDNWPSGSVEATEWKNAFSFRSVNTFKATWESTDNLYGNLSTDRLGGWHRSQVPNMAYPFFDYPTGDYGPLSLGSFQHADLSVYSWQPTYAFGNAQAPPRFDRSEFKSSSQQDLYDISYLLNASTWDSYYLSTIPQSGETLEPGMRLPNSRQYLTSIGNDGEFDSSILTNADGFDLSASSVMVHGGFNVNSTSVTAWKAFLSGALGQSVETLHSSTDSNTADAAAMGRFLAPLVEEPNDVPEDRSANTDFSEVNSWAATRTLNSTEIDTLANRIVEEVKLRGPFLSLGDFVNRRLEPDSDVTGDERVYQEVLGTLQAAINKSTTEDQQINYHYYAAESSSGTKMTIKPSQDWSGSSMNFSVSSDAQEAMFGAPKSVIDSDGGLIHSYAPNFISQADVLSRIGPSITVRGDTFVIRAYGDSIDPTTGEVQARAWCEAVVQRSAKPVGWDGSNSKLVQPQALNETGFGRRFNVMSFRWLNEKDVMPFSDDDSIVN